MYRLITVAVLIIGAVTGCEATSGYRDIRPACKAPAPLEGKFDPRAPSFLVELQPAADPPSVATDLAIRYSGFHPRNVVSPGAVVIAGEMTPQTVAALRCDAAVKRISHDQILEHLF